VIVAVFIKGAFHHIKQFPSHVGANAYAEGLDFAAWLFDGPLEAYVLPGEAREMHSEMKLTEINRGRKELERLFGHKARLSDFNNR
jgi:hypothetical protein